MVRKELNTFVFGIQNKVGFKGEEDEEEEGG